MLERRRKAMCALKPDAKYTTEEKGHTRGGAQESGWFY